MQEGARETRGEIGKDERKVDVRFGNPGRGIPSRRAIPLQIATSALAVAATVSARLRSCSSILSDKLTLGLGVMEEDGFVIVSKDFTAEDDGGLSASSSRSSLFLVEDPSADEVMLNGEKDEEAEPVVKVPPKHQSLVIEEPLKASKESLGTEPEEAKEVKVRILAKPGRTSSQTSLLPG